LTVFARLADVFKRSLSMGSLGFWLYGVTLLRFFYGSFLEALKDSRQVL
jgi:hypothetical protein